MSVSNAVDAINARLAAREEQAWEQVQAVRARNVFVAAELAEPDGSYIIYNTIYASPLSQDDIKSLSTAIDWQGDEEHLDKVLRNVENVAQTEFDEYGQLIQEKCENYLRYRVSCNARS